MLPLWGGQHFIFCTLVQNNAEKLRHIIPVKKSSVWVLTNFFPPTLAKYSVILTTEESAFFADDLPSPGNVLNLSSQGINYPFWQSSEKVSLLGAIAGADPAECHFKGNVASPLRG